MKRIITYKFLLKPNTAQKTIIKKSIDNARYIYNQLLHTKNVAYNSYGVLFDKGDLQRLIPCIKNSSSWLNTIYSQTAQDVNIRLDNAFKKMYQDIKDGTVKKKQSEYLERCKRNGKPVNLKKHNQMCRPKWAKKGHYSSLTYPQNCSIIEEGVLKMPHLKMMKFKDTVGLATNTVVKQVNIQYDCDSGKYFVSIIAEKDFKPLPKSKKKIGIDMGVAQVVTCSDGLVIANPRHFNNSKDELRIEQRKMSRQTLRGKNWKKTKRRINKIQTKTANQRKDFLHKLSTELINENQVIVHDNLRIKNMTKKATVRSVKAKSGLNRSMLDVGMFTFFEMLRYKADRYGREIIKVNPAYTSQMCSNCKEINKESRKSQSKYECISCGHKMNADLNASINILEKGVLPSRKRGALARA